MDVTHQFLEIRVLYSGRRSSDSTTAEIYLHGDYDDVYTCLRSVLICKPYYVC